MPETIEHLGHNPDADLAERLRVRASFNLKEHLAATASAPKAETKDIDLDELRENLRKGDVDIFPLKEIAELKSQIASAALTHEALLRENNQLRAELAAIKAPKDPGQPPEVIIDAETEPANTEQETK
jgi:hypothetical protein